MSVHSKSKKMTIRFQTPSAEETFRKNTKKAMQARTERPPEDFGASEMGFGGAGLQENSMRKIRIIREEVEETFQLTVGDLKRIINEELGRLDEQANNPNAVKAVQAALNMLGYPQLSTASGRPLAVDGDYGPRTKKVVEDFQSALGLEDDGAVGPKTAKVIQRELDVASGGALSGIGDLPKATKYADPVGDPESGDMDDDSMRTPGDTGSTGRKPVERVKTPEDYVGSQAVVDKIEAAANDKRRFKDPVMAAATLKKFADQGDRELLSALRDLADREGKRVQQRSMQIARDLTDILSKTTDPENREKLKQSFLNQLKSDASVMAQRLQIPAFRPRSKPLDIPGPVAESINEQLDPSGDPEYTLDVVDRLLNMIQAERMVLRTRRRRVSEQSVAPPYVPGSPKVTGTYASGERFDVPVGDTDSGDEEASMLPPGLKLIEPHTNLSSASRSSLTRKETPQWTREEGMVFISQDKSSHGEHQFAQDPYTYDSDGDDYIVISGPRPGAIGKKIRKDATSPRMKKAHTLLDKRLGKAPAAPIGAPDPGEPEAKDAESAEQLSSDEIQKEVDKAVAPLAGELRDRMEDPGVVAYVDSIDEIIDGYTTRDDFEVAWSMTYKLISSDGDLLPKSRVANGVYAEESGFGASDAAMIGAAAAVLLIPLTGGASLAALGGSLAAGAKAAGITGAVSAAATGAGFAGLTGLTTATSTAAAFYAGVGATALGGALAADALIEKGYPEEARILAAMSSTELANDWASEASGESPVEEIIGSAISNVWRKIATDPTYNKAQALSDLKKPLDAQKINWKRFEQERGFIGSVFGQ